VVAQEKQFPRWLRCVTEQAMSLDDFRSDARTVAGAIIQVCRQSLIDDFRTKLPEHLKQMPDVDRQLGGIVDADREKGLAWVSGAVLYLRRTHPTRESRGFVIR
jgi:hypothetical protein